MKKLLFTTTVIIGILVTVLTVFAQQTPDPQTIYLPFIKAAKAEPLFDMVNYMAGGNGRLYEVQHSGGSQARHQTQGDLAHFYHTKGNEVSAEWEELWATDDHILRGTDTSPGNGHYYTLYDQANTPGSLWAPRHWRVGDIFERNPLVIFYNKSNCQIVASGMQRSWLKFVAHHEQYTFHNGITLNEVVELAWLLDPNGSPIESYFYAQGYGLVGWGSNDRGYSYISEIHEPGQRPDNNREVIGCLGQRRWQLLADEINYGPLPPPFRAK